MKYLLLIIPFLLLGGGCQPKAKCYINGERADVSECDALDKYFEDNFDKKIDSPNVTSTSGIPCPRSEVSFTCYSGTVVTGTITCSSYPDWYYLCREANPVCTHLKDITPTEKGTLALDEFTNQTCMNKEGKWVGL